MSAFENYSKKKRGNHQEEVLACNHLRKFIYCLHNQSIKPLKDFDVLRQAWPAADAHRALCHYSQRTENILQLEDIKAKTGRYPSYSEGPDWNIKEQKDILNSAGYIRQYRENLDNTIGSKKIADYLNKEEIDFLVERHSSKSVPDITVDKALERFEKEIDKLKKPHENYIASLKKEKK
jgi:hypothetical protein